MFFYISFLRPPPTQSPPPNQIHITPQVSNDLRTEPYNFSQDIYYSWIGPLQGLVSSKKTIATTKATVKKATKLTVYRTSSAFKEISVPPPTGVRDGQQWQLVLAPSPDVIVNYSIDLFDENIGSGMPFPVTSMPILFSSKGLGGKRVLRKQERIQRVYRISNGGGETENSIEGSSPRELRITEQTSFDLDKVRLTSSSFRIHEKKSVNQAEHRKYGTVELVLVLGSSSFIEHFTVRINRMHLSECYGTGCFLRNNGI